MKCYTVLCVTPASRDAMPSARWKSKSKARNLHAPIELDQFSHVELSQCSPHLCAICEHAGDLVICDGPCHRQFHVRRSVQELPSPHCPGVCIPEGNSSDSWHCPDCTTSRAKCFQCGLLGRMHSEVRKCLATYCVCWYCRRCFPLEKSTCALHSCHACDLPFSSESLEDAVQCLRCPSSWHPDCLEHIQRKDVNKTRWGVDRPPWQHVAHDQIRQMVYCPNHPLDPTLGTPALDHISWL